MWNSPTSSARSTQSCFPWQQACLWLWCWKVTQWHYKNLMFKNKSYGSSIIHLWPKKNCPPKKKVCQKRERILLQQHRDPCLCFCSWLAIRWIPEHRDIHIFTSSCVGMVSPLAVHNSVCKSKVSQCISVFQWWICWRQAKKYDFFYSKNASPKVQLI